MDLCSSLVTSGETEAGLNRATREGELRSLSPARTTRPEGPQVQSVLLAYSNEVIRHSGGTTSVGQRGSGSLIVHRDALHHFSPRSEEEIYPVPRLSVHHKENIDWGDVLGFMLTDPK